MKKQRGATLIEMMMASMVLIIGLTGITQLLTHGMNAFRNATVQAASQFDSASAVADMMMTPMAALTAGTYDGGTTIDLDGRHYQRVIVVSDVVDSGIIARRIEVRTSWTDTSGHSQTGVSYAIVSQKPDAN